jgi:hypothetical protein
MKPRCRSRCHQDQTAPRLGQQHTPAAEAEAEAEEAGQTHTRAPPHSLCPRAAMATLITNSASRTRSAVPYGQTPPASTMNGSTHAPRPASRSPPGAATSASPGGCTARAFKSPADCEREYRTTLAEDWPHRSSLATRGFPWRVYSLNESPSRRNVPPITHLGRPAEPQHQSSLCAAAEPGKAPGARRKPVIRPRQEHGPAKTPGAACHPCGARLVRV